MFLPSNTSALMAYFVFLDSIKTKLIKFGDFVLPSHLFEKSVAFLGSCFWEKLFTKKAQKNLSTFDLLLNCVNTHVQVFASYFIHSSGIVITQIFIDLLFLDSMADWIWILVPSGLMVGCG